MTAWGAWPRSELRLALYGQTSERYVGSAKRFRAYNRAGVTLSEDSQITGASSNGTTTYGYAVAISPR